VQLVSVRLGERRYCLSFVVVAIHHQVKRAAGRMVGVRIVGPVAADHFQLEPLADNRGSPASLRLDWPELVVAAPVTLGTAPVVGGMTAGAANEARTRA